MTVCILQMGITSRDHSTPVLLLRNISQHLNGTARTIGAALVGHFGKYTSSYFENLISTKEGRLAGTF